MIKGMTISDAAHKWVSEFNAIPQSMIERLMRAAPDEWEELTLPHAGSRVHVFDLPDSCDTLEHLGEILAYAADLNKYRVDLDGGPSILVELWRFLRRLLAWVCGWYSGDVRLRVPHLPARGVGLFLRHRRRRVRFLQRALDSALQKSRIAVARPRRRKS